MRRLTLSQALILAIVVALLPVVVFAVWQGIASRTYAEGLIRERLLATARANCPADLKVTAWTDDGEIMGVRHTELDIEGVQFHPESILTEHGHAMLKNFLDR